MLTNDDGSMGTTAPFAEAPIMVRSPRSDTAADADTISAVAVGALAATLAKTSTPSSQLSAVVRDVARVQTTMLADLNHAAEMVQGIEVEMKRIDATFSKLPHYVAKLGLLVKNAEILRENAAKTRQLAEKLAHELLSST